MFRRFPPCDNPAMKLAAWTLVALALVFGGWKFMEHRELARYGISAATPFGTFEKLDAVLTQDMKFTRVEAPPDVAGFEDMPEVATSYKYLDTAPGGAFPDKIWLQVGADGRLVALTAMSRPSYSAVSLFMRNHWTRVANERLDFDKGQGEGSGPGWRGRWAWGRPAYVMVFAVP